LLKLESIVEVVPKFTEVDRVDNFGMCNNNSWMAGLVGWWVRVTTKINTKGLGFGRQTRVA
jgi:hypothetical protein